jgi:divalent metal cation (Fe/Co/Zn/Cd) transporter
VQTQTLRERCLRVNGIVSVVHLQARRSGPFLYVECTVGVPGNLSASAAHRLAELARQVRL